MTVRIPQRVKRGTSKTRKNGAPRRKSDDDYPTARMTKQTRGDIAEALRVRQAVLEGREKLIPWEQVKRELARR